jgi:DnaJ-class molecular chaperone
MDYYSILDISTTASYIDIKKAYHKQALLWHPDKNDNSTESINNFQKISEAYQILSDKHKRADYDTFGTSFTNLKSPVELFGELFNDIDPVIYNFLTNTFSNIADASDMNSTNFWDIFKNIDKDKLIEEGGNIVKHILKKSLIDTSNDTPRNDTTSNDTPCNDTPCNDTTSNISDEYIYKLLLNVDDIDDINSINLTIDCVRSFTHIKLNLFNKDTNVSYLLDTNYDEHIISFMNKKYSFLLEDSFPEGYSRHNIYDIVLKHDIHYKYISTGYKLDYVYENNNPLHLNIYFSHNSNIVKLPEKGCLNTKTKTYGDLYIILNYMYNDPFSILEKNRCKNDIPVYDTLDPISLLANGYNNI